MYELPSNSAPLFWRQHLNPPAMARLQQRKTEALLRRDGSARPCVRPHCTGYLSLLDERCSVCSAEICPDCREEIQPNHICSRETLLSRTEIQKSTRPCPHCRANIYRISGCNQMWCTHCHSAFHWETGKTLLVFHNPHCRQPPPPSHPHPSPPPLLLLSDATARSLAMDMAPLTPPHPPLSPLVPTSSLFFFSLPLERRHPLSPPSLLPRTTIHLDRLLEKRSSPPPS